MPGAIAHTAVKGARELERALLQLRRDTFIGLRPELRKLAKLVAGSAHTRSVHDITNIEGGFEGVDWSWYRIGSTSKLGAEMVYVAPKRRNTGGRPTRSLAFQLSREMEAALDEYKDDIEEGLSHLIDAAAMKSGMAAI